MISHNTRRDRVDESPARVGIPPKLAKPLRERDARKAAAPAAPAAPPPAQSAAAARELVEAARVAGLISFGKAAELNAKAGTLGVEGVKIVLDALAERRREAVRGGQSFRNSQVDDDTAYTSPKTAAASSADLTAEEQRVIKAQGLNPQRYIETRNRMRAEQAKGGAR